MRDRLTPRQAEICGAVARGLSNKAIAEQLGITERTVKETIGAALARHGAAVNRVTLVLWYLATCGDAERVEILNAALPKRAEAA